MSRSNISAYGPEGISNLIWKLGKKYTREMIKNTMWVTMKLLNELIQHVSRNEGSIYITTIDFADAFGSIPHSQIFKSMKEMMLANQHSGKILLMMQIGLENLTNG